MGRPDEADKAGRQYGRRGGEGGTVYNFLLLLN